MLSLARCPLRQHTTYYPSSVLVSYSPACNIVCHGGLSAMYTEETTEQKAGVPNATPPLLAADPNPPSYNHCLYFSRGDLVKYRCIFACTVSHIQCCCFSFEESIFGFCFKVPMSHAVSFVIPRRRLCTDVSPQATAKCLSHRQQGRENTFVGLIGRKCQNTLLLLNYLLMCQNRFMLYRGS